MSTPISSTSSSTSTQTDTSQQDTQAAIQALLRTGPSISFGGLVSGLNTQQIVQALLAADQAPILQLQSQQAHEQQKLTAWQDINSKLQALQAAADTLGLQGTVSAKNVVFTGPSGTFATGTATPTAANGIFQLQIDQLATATKVASTTGIGRPIVGTDVATFSSKLATAVTQGTFSIGVTDPVTGAVTYHQVAVTLGDTWDAILANISSATSGDVTGTVTGNGIQLQSNNGQPILLGSGGDTSNFLSVTKLLGQPSATTMSSSGPVGVSNPAVALDQASINGLATGTTTGTFTINGVTINYNSTTDSLNTILDRINSSAAGVTATYDPNSDTVSLTSSKTGNIDVSVADGNGNLMASLGLLAPAAHQLGKSAKYEINGVTQYSLTNTVKNIVPGVTVTLQAVTTSPLTGTVSIDTSVGTKAIKDFVTAYNAVADLIQKDTDYNQRTKKAGIFLGDLTVSTIQQQLDQGLFISNGLQKGLTAPYTDISTIGLSTGAIGSKPGTTLDLQFDENKFQTALTTNPAAVTNLVNTVFGQLSKSVFDLIKPFGLVDSAIRAEDRQILDYQNEIDDQTQRLQDREQALNQQFNQLDEELARLQAASTTGAAVLASLAAQGAKSGSSPQQQ
jgi:flagellar hook-associated protein 2